MPAIGRFRRILGLNVFAYALMHLLCYAWLDMGFEWEDIYLDILKRPFIYVGFTAFVLLSALALTSNNPTIAWMGAKRWRFLHRLVYVIAPLAVLHFYWMRAGKQRFEDVILYGSILALLLLFRWIWKIKAKKVQISSA
jgi:sulfoxide reductase heme-binding subunit YedZ